MTKDKDLESIKKGNGLGNSSTNTSTQSSGTKTDQRGQLGGLRLDLFSHDEGEKKGNT